jgi:hypothetical protein
MNLNMNCIGDTLQKVYGLTDDEANTLEQESRGVSKSKNKKRKDDSDDDVDEDDDIDDKVHHEQDDASDTLASSSSSTSAEGNVVDDDNAGDFEESDDSSESSSLGRGEPLEAPTRRLAVLNCDWDRVSGTDLLYALRSYAPNGGSVRSVTIYPSDFGLERMNEEEMRAPDVFRMGEDARAEIDRARGDADGFEVEERVEEPRDDAPALNDTAETRKASTNADFVEQDDSDDERLNAAREMHGNEHFDENDSDAESEDVDDVELEDEDALPEISSSVDTDEEDDSSDLAMKALFEGAVSRQRMGGKGIDEDGMFDETKLRRYQRDRLKYFYAIAEFDSPATAAVVKKECQSVELEATANVFELRYVPDDMTFDDREPRETVSTVPEQYKPPRWYTPAVAHTAVSLTWDEADRNRTALTTRQWTVQDLVNEEQFANLLPGSEEGSEFSSAGDLGALLKHDDDDDDEESSEVSSATRESRLKELRSKARKARIRKRYAALLEGGSAEGGGGKDDDDEEEEDSGSEDMEITFQSGFSDKATTLLKSHDDSKASVERTWWEVQQEKQAALRTVRHRAKVEALAKGMNEEQLRAYVIEQVQLAKKDAASVNSRNPFEAFEEGFDDAPKEFADDVEDREANPKLSRREARREARKRERKERRNAKKPTAAENEAQQRARDELALVMMPSEQDEREADEGFSVAGLLQAENKKRKNGRKARDTDHGPVSNFEFDVADTRFSAVLENPAFAIDPNEPAFIDTAGMRDVMSKRAERQAQLRDRDAAERQRRRDVNRSARGVGGGAAAAAEDAATRQSSAPSSAAVNMLIAGIKQRSLGADRLKRPQQNQASSTDADDGRPKRPRLLQNKRAERKNE